MRNKLEKLHVGGESFQAASILDKANQIHTNITKILNDIAIHTPATIGAHDGIKVHQSKLDGFIQIEHGTDDKNCDVEDRPSESQLKCSLSLSIYIYI